MPLESSFRHRALLTCALLAWPLCLPAAEHGLAQLIDQAIHHHPRIAVAEANISHAQSQLDTANWQYFPTVSMSLESAYHQQDDSQYAGDDLVAQLNLNQPLWQWGALDAGVDIASSQLALATIQHRQQQWQLAEAVIESYGKWLAAHLATQAWQGALDDHQTLLQQVDKRVRQGASAAIDLALAQGRVASTQAEFMASKDALVMALQELRQLTSLELTNEALHGLISQPKTALLEDSQSLALGLSPAVQLAATEVHLAQQQLRQQRAQLKPAFYLRAEHRVNDFASADTPPRTRVFVGVSGSTGAGLSWQSQQQSAQANVLAKQASLVDSRQQVQQRFDHLSTRFVSLQRHLANLMQAKEDTEAVAASYGRQFLAGRKSWQEVMNSAREKVQMQVQIADLEAAYLVASWQLALYVEGIDGVSQEVLPMSLELLEAQET